MPGFADGVSNHGRVIKPTEAQRAKFHDSRQLQQGVRNHARGLYPDVPRTMVRRMEAMETARRMLQAVKAVRPTLRRSMHTQRRQKTDLN